MTATQRSVRTCIVVVEVEQADGKLVVGALADSVEEVIDLEPDQIQPTPSIGAGFNTEFNRGMGKRDNEFLMILDIDKVFSSEDLAAVRDGR
jgi:purine-binding chemotaxis protein CheW